MSFEGDYMTQKISVRRATEDDAPKLLEIYAPFVLNTAVTFEYEVPSVAKFAGRISDTLKKYPYLVASLDGEIAGYAYAGAFKERAAYSRCVEITVYVNERYKRCGIGQTLYHELEKALCAQGVLNLNACIAYTERQDDHLTQDSVLFHEKQGFCKVAHFHKCGFKFNRWYDMIWMEKLIGEHENGI